jgi:hypothetical protein
VLRLRATVESFTTRVISDKCPRFTKKVFDALERVQPTLKIFLQLTLDYSEVGAHAYRILPDLINAIDQIKEIHDHPSVSNTRKLSAQAASKILTKYLKRFLKNSWVCAASALDPAVRLDGLYNLMKSYGMSQEYLNVVAWMEWRMEPYLESERRTVQEKGFELVKRRRKEERVNKFASDRYKTGHQEVTHDMEDPWACYASTMTRFATNEDESVLAYWQRMSQEYEMEPFARMAADILGLAASSASVERLFSHAGHVLGRRRGSLSTRLLSKQVMLRMWEKQGFLTTEDLRALSNNL